MASDKAVKLAILAAMVTVVLGVAGYVVVFWHNYQGCQQLEAEAARDGKPMSCADIKAAAKARQP
jgi:flagellar basal body-associated protein FliL